MSHVYSYLLNASLLIRQETHVYLNYQFINNIQNTKNV